jgi:hypothetical protein
MAKLGLPYNFLAISSLKIAGQPGEEKFSFTHILHLAIGNRGYTNKTRLRGFKP